MMKHPKSFNSVVASVQPLEASTRFDNTLPSKGYIQGFKEFSLILFYFNNWNIILIQKFKLFIYFYFLKFLCT